jgi:hypothetical protein
MVIKPRAGTMTTSRLDWPVCAGRGSSALHAAMTSPRASNYCVFTATPLTGPHQPGHPQGAGLMQMQPAGPPHTKNVTECPLVWHHRHHRPPTSSHQLSHPLDSCADTSSIGWRWAADQHPGLCAKTNGCHPRCCHHVSLRMLHYSGQSWPYQVRGWRLADGRMRGAR